MKAKKPLLGISKMQTIVRDSLRFLRAFKFYVNSIFIKINITYLLRSLLSALTSLQTARHSINNYINFDLEKVKVINNKGESQKWRENS